MVRSKKIQKWLSKNFDIVFLSETHLLKGEKYKIDSFKDYHNAFSTNEDLAKQMQMRKKLVLTNSGILSAVIATISLRRLPLLLTHDCTTAGT